MRMVRLRWHKLQDAMVDMSVSKWPAVYVREYSPFVPNPLSVATSLVQRCPQDLKRATSLREQQSRYGWFLQGSVLSHTKGVLALNERLADPKASRTDRKQRATQTQSIVRWVGRGGQIEKYGRHVAHVPIDRFLSRGPRKSARNGTCHSR